MAEYTAEARAQVHGLFEAHGYPGVLLVVDHSGDETIFVIQQAALDAIAVKTLVTALQAVLRRKVWVVEDSPVWVRQAQPFT